MVFYILAAPLPASQSRNDEDVKGLEKKVEQKIKSNCMNQNGRDYGDIYEINVCAQTLQLLGGQDKIQSGDARLAYGNERNSDEARPDS